MCDSRNTITSYCIRAAVVQTVLLLISTGDCSVALAVFRKIRVTSHTSSMEISGRFSDMLVSCRILEILRRVYKSSAELIPSLANT